MEGRFETRLLAANLYNVNFDKIYSSPTLRAQESMAILFGELNRKGRTPAPAYKRALRTIDAPSRIGLPVAGSVNDNGFYKTFYRTQGDESPEEYLNRIWSAFQDIVKRNEGKTIGIMGHSEGIGLIMHRLHHPEDPTPRIEGAIPTGSAIKFEINPESLEIRNESRIPENAHDPESFDRSMRK